MSAEDKFLDSILHGPTWSGSRSLPLTFHARLCDLRPRFLPKWRVGRVWRAIARNGRVLLASDQPLSNLTDKLVRVRLQRWNKAILPGDKAQPYGILLVVRVLEEERRSEIYATRLASRSDEPFDVAIDVGGRSRLEFRREG